jgi:DNA-binding transcriptional ArsR family regulator
VRNGAKLKEPAALFSALGDETRLALVAALGRQGPQSISRLASGKKISRQAVTKHLEILRAAGIAHCHQNGREKIWDLDQRRLQIAQGYLQLMSRRWDHALGRLKDLVED